MKLRLVVDVDGEELLKIGEPWTTMIRQESRVIDNDGSPKQFFLYNGDDSSEIVKYLIEIIVIDNLEHLTRKLIINYHKSSIVIVR